MNPLIENITTIKLESPVDKIIEQLKFLITSGQLKPGDRLPAERVLSDKFGVGRSYIREAILKLEFYGLLKTNPQSGTYVSGLSINVIDNIISDIIKFNRDDFNALIEARYHLELAAVKLAAERRTENDLVEIKNALNDYEYKIKNNGPTAVEEDMIFHIKIANASKNSVISSMVLILIPDLIKNIVENKICGENRGKKSIPEHREILKAIEKRDAHLAEKAMAAHLNDIWQISKAGFAAISIIQNDAYAPANGTAPVNEKTTAKNTGKITAKVTGKGKSKATAKEKVRGTTHSTGKATQSSNNKKTASAINGSLNKEKNGKAALLTARKTGAK